MPSKEEQLKAERWLKSIRDEAAAKRGRGQKTSVVMEALWAEEEEEYKDPDEETVDLKAEETPLDTKSEPDVKGEEGVGRGAGVVERPAEEQDMEQFNVEESGYGEYQQPYESYAPPQYYKFGQPVTQPYGYEAP
jgi:hypothetical protein